MIMMADPTLIEAALKAGDAVAPELVATAKSTATTAATAAAAAVVAAAGLVVARNTSGGADSTASAPSARAVRQPPAGTNFGSIAERANYQRPGTVKFRAGTPAPKKKATKASGGSLFGKKQAPPPKKKKKAFGLF